MLILAQPLLQKNLEDGMVTILRPPQKSEKCQGGALNLSQAKLAPKQLNLKSLAMQADLKFSGCPTPADSLFWGGRSIYEGDSVPLKRPLSG